MQHVYFGFSLLLFLSVLMIVFADETTTSKARNCNSCIVPTTITTKSFDGFENGIVTSFERNQNNCKWVKLQCMGINLTDYSQTVFQVHGSASRVINGYGVAPLSLDFKCNEVGLWSSPSSLGNSEYYKLDTVECRVRIPSAQISPATKAISTTTKAPSSNQITCNKNKKFQLLSSKALSSISTQGKFGGFYKNRSACQKICNQSYGMFNCSAFMYEPKYHGKCTIFESYVELKITESPSSTGLIFKKCF